MYRLLPLPGSDRFFVLLMEIRFMDYFSFKLAEHDRGFPPEGENMCNFDTAHPENWKYRSSDEPGFHTVVSPENSACKETWIFRLNLKKGESEKLRKDSLEMSAAVIAGTCRVECESSSDTLVVRDSFYLPGGKAAEVTAVEDCSVFIGAGPYEGTGEFFTRHLDMNLPLGEIHQVHGKPPYQREVHMCINQEVPGSRLITGITWGEDGKWTSWPPHQHTKDLEEVYCYFDIPAPKFALHLASRKPGVVEFVHPVSTGDCVVVPEGYHPTVGMPGAKSCYFWVMTAHRKESRRYDLAVNDPDFE